MRIAYDHQIFGWQRFGGVSRYFFELANHLSGAESGAIQCLAASPLYVNDYLHHASPALHVKGIHVPAIRHSGRIYRKVNGVLAPRCVRAWKPDILHETYYSRTTVAPRGCRTVLTVFDMIHELYPGYFPAWDPTREEKRVAISRADHIVCISENTRRDLIRLLGVPEEKTTVVHLGFALTASEPATLPEPRRPFLLFVGSRGGYKNFDRLLAAYSAHPELRDAFDLVAFGGGKLTSSEQALIHRLGLSEMQVRQQGGDDSVLNALYRQAALFVYPSLYEGFGIPPLEAMSFDCPVVCSNTSSIPEVVGDAAVQFDPHEIDSIANTLAAVAADHELQSKLRGRGRERVEVFSWNKCAGETLGVYRRVLA